MLHYFENACLTFSDASGITVDTVRFLFCLLLGIPFAFIYHSFPQNGFVNLKHLYSGGVGFLFCYLCYGFEIFHSLFTLLISYGAYRLLHQPHRFVFPFCMLYLAVAHVYRQVYFFGHWGVDFTALQMIVTIKLTSLAYNISDGRKEKKDLNPEQSQLCVRTPPSFMEVFSFVYYFGNCMAGPCVEFKEHMDFITGAMFPTGKRPSPYGHMLKTLLFAIFHAIGYFLGLLISLDRVMYGSLADAPFVIRFFYITTSVSLHRFKYYFGWTLTETVCTMSGLAYAGKDEEGKPLWTRVRNCHVLACEFPRNVKHLLDSWNIGTAKWLRRYVYVRAGPLVGNSLATHLVTLVSAAWHGFYPGYYFSFICLGMVTVQARHVRRNIRPLVLSLAHKYGPVVLPAYDTLTTTVTWIMVNTIAVPFCVLSFEDSMVALKAIYFAPFWVIGAEMLFYYCGGYHAFKQLFHKLVPVHPN
eukprot:GCRY01004777.1.p1 GENE.GCRY01004777.1~~GCRY01004777.1.p1  ORF type:complete len:470 (-),score=91.83 GCRY01004777.1:128-1537(-)